jgi:L-prolyl-PCP dehydrogenase
MDFGWSDAETELYERTRRFAAEALGDGLEERLRSGRFDRDAWQRLATFGLLGAPVPAALGGLGLSALSTARVVEALGRGCSDMGLVFSAMAHLFACLMPILEHADPALRDDMVPRLARGEWIGANAITEAEAGSDAFALKARAVPDGDGYRITGAKTYVTNGPIADVFLVYASTDPTRGYLGVSAFVAKKGDHGLRAGERFETMGLETSPIGAVYFDECWLPAGRRLGAEGEGADIFKRSMAWERTCLFAAYLGAMDRQLDACVEFAGARRQFQKAIGRNQAVSHRIADMKLRLEAARLLLYRACWLRDQKADADLAVALAKLAVSEAAVESGLDAIRVHGGVGVVRDARIERALRDAIPSTIFSGTSEMQRSLIAAALGI